MDWSTEWLALSGCINGLLAAGRFLCERQQIYGRDTSLATGETLGEQAAGVFNHLFSFAERFSSVLLAAAQLAFARFFERQRVRFTAPMGPQIQY